MGLLDGVLNALQGANAPGGAGNGLGAALGAVLNGAGGGNLGTLVQQFEQGGLGPVIASWISTGHNLPISPDQLQAVLGNDTITRVAQHLGVEPGQAAAQLAQWLPTVVDRMTPNGQLPAGDNHTGLLNEVLGSLAGR
jgi:uncharacterized protein YidB (DUF937 family)